MSLEFIVEITLIALLIIFAIMAVELKKLVYAVASLGLMSTVLSIIFYVLYAPYVAVINLLVYAGAIIVLFLAVLSLTTPGEEEKIETKQEIATRISGGVLFIIIAIILVQVLITSYVGLQFAYGRTLNLPELMSFQDILKSVAQSIWQVRVMDVLIQAMALFVAGLGVATLFRKERREEK